MHRSENSKADFVLPVTQRALSLISRCIFLDWFVVHHHNIRCS